MRTAVSNRTMATPEVEELLVVATTTSSSKIGPALEPASAAVARAAERANALMTFFMMTPSTEIVRNHTSEGGHFLQLSLDIALRTR